MAKHLPYGVDAHAAVQQGGTAAFPVFVGAPVRNVQDLTVLLQQAVDASLGNDLVTQSKDITIIGIAMGIWYSISKRLQIVAERRIRYVHKEAIKISS